MQKVGPPMQDLRCVRVDSHRPAGRLDDMSPSRHERIPPASVVLMFNCYEAGFELEAGDITTIPEAEALEIRSLTSGKVLGTVHISSVKNTALEERIVFKDSWFVRARARARAIIFKDSWFVAEAHTMHMHLFPRHAYASSRDGLQADPRREPNPHPKLNPNPD